VVKFLRANRAEAEKQLPSELLHYLGERVLPSTWYPLEDYWGLMRVLVSIAKVGPDGFAQMGHFLARTDLAGIYKSVVHAGDPGRTMASTTAIWRNYYDEGRIRVELERAAALLTLHDFPYQVRELCGQLEGYFAEMAIASGAQEVKALHLSCRLRGGPSCRWRVSWSS
jgi:hypothetical protein